jgi:nitroreductase
VTDPRLTTALRRAAVRATRAPSVHNTQPWRLVLTGSTLELRSDPDRRLRVLDPNGRQLVLSCGCALFNARVALADAGFVPIIDRFPDPGDPGLLATISIDPAADRNVGVDEDIAALAPAIELRQTNRRRFDDHRVPAEILRAIAEASAIEGAEITIVTRAEDRLAVAMLTQKADEIENADPAYRAELRAWTSDDPMRSDGVPSFAIPHVDGAAHDDVPIRDFDTRGSGALPARTGSSLEQDLVLLGSLEDNQLAWLRTGEALERVLLEIAARGYTASFFTQVIEVTRTNVLLRQELRLGMHPQVLLRVGRAERTPLTRRRRLVDVLGDAN